MWWVLFALVVLIAWAVWFTFGLSLAIPIATSVVVVLFAAALFVFRRFRASRFLC